MQYRRLLRQEIEKVAGGQKPMLFLDDAHARSIQGPATMDGIGPTRGWETFWMEVDVKRRRSAPWAAPVPQEIADKVRHLKAVCEFARHSGGALSDEPEPGCAVAHREVSDCRVRSLTHRLAMTALKE